MGHDDAAANLYAYVVSNSVNLSDPMGLEVQLCCRRTMGLFVHCFVRLQCFGQTVTTYSLMGRYWRRPGPNVWVANTEIGNSADSDAQAALAGVRCVSCTTPEIIRGRGAIALCQLGFGHLKCLQERLCLTYNLQRYPIRRYEAMGRNSNTFARWLANQCCSVPPAGRPRPEGGFGWTPGWDRPPPGPADNDPELRRMPQTPEMGRRTW